MVGYVAGHGIKSWACRGASLLVHVIKSWACRGASLLVHVIESWVCRGARGGTLRIQPLDKKQQFCCFVKILGAVIGDGGIPCAVDDDEYLAGKGFDPIWYLVALGKLG